MEGLQRSTISFRRQGSSGLVWDDRFVSGELNRLNNETDETANKPIDSDGGQEPSRDITAHNPPPPIETAALERNRSTGGGGRYRMGRVSPAMDPPSPKVSACGFCRAFRKHSDQAKKKGKHGNRRRSR